MTDQEKDEVLYFAKQKFEDAKNQISVFFSEKHQKNKLSGYKNYQLNLINTLVNYSAGKKNSIMSSHFKSSILLLQIMR
jgi:hypothetical protein